MNTSKITVRRLTVIGVLSAAAFLLQLLGTVLPFKVGGFLEIEFLNDIECLCFNCF